MKIRRNDYKYMKLSLKKRKLAEIKKNKRGCGSGFRAELTKVRLKSRRCECFNMFELSIIDFSLCILPLNLRFP